MTEETRFPKALWKPIIYNFIKAINKKHKEVPINNKHKISTYLQHS